MQHFVQTLRTVGAAALGGLLVVLPAFAEEFADPPGRVARLAFVAGAVSIAAADTDAWSEAFVNRPLTRGDRIWVDAGARAELDVGTLLIRLDENTSLSLSALSDDAFATRLNEGVVQLQVLRLDTPIEITTPSAVVTVLQPGSYTIEAAASGQQTVVKNYDGAVEVAGPGEQSYGVAAGEQGVFVSAPTFSAEFAALAPRSEFEMWASARDAATAAPVTAQYVAPAVVGYRDLDRYGTWSATTDYGYVWQPSYVAAGWAPYRYGRWVWVTPWGWTWVDDTPWGFAPFHYGRWVYLRARWCWAPGPRYVRPVYAPALVGWIGYPGAPDVGWFPLAPREAYLPGYRTSWRYFRNVNVANTWFANTAYISDAYHGRAAPIDYRHRRTPHATTVVTRDSFTSGRPLGPHRGSPGGGVATGWVAQGRPPTIEPSRASRFGVHSAVHPPRAASTPRPPRGDFRTPTDVATRPALTRDGTPHLRTPAMPSAPPRNARTPIDNPAAAPGARTPIAVQRHWSGRRVDGVSTRTDHRAGAPPDRRGQAPSRRAEPALRAAAPASRDVASSPPPRTAPHRDAASRQAFPHRTAREPARPTQPTAAPAQRPGMAAERSASAAPAARERHAGFGVRQEQMQSRSLPR